MINPNWIFGFFQKKNPNWIFGFFQTKNFEEISKKSDELLVFFFLISKVIFPYSIQVKLTFRDAFCFIAHCSFKSHLQHLHSKAVRCVLQATSVLQIDFSLMAHVTYYIIISLHHLYIFLDINSKCNCSIIPFYLISKNLLPLA